jgi:NDP-sugar pyrophosphorylase family protein|tara:strand:- start:152 stop:766 length:615 start_codon:yes stop_codon:yes gene_type:complete
MKIVIIGIGSAAIMIADIIGSEHNYEVVGFIGTEEENKKFKNKTIYRDIPLLGSRKVLKDLNKNQVGGFIAAIGDNYVREQAFYEAKNEGLIAVNAISRNAFIENNVTIKSGVVIGSGSILQHGVEIGDNSYISSGCILDFKSKVNENCYLSPGCVLGSKSNLEKNVSIGPRSVVKSKIIIGKNQVISANTIIDKNLDNLPREK